MIGIAHDPGFDRGLEGIGPPPSGERRQIHPRFLDGVNRIAIHFAWEVSGWRGSFMATYAIKTSHIFTSERESYRDIFHKDLFDTIAAKYCRWGEKSCH
jgi:hypothetical protein